MSAKLASTEYLFICYADTQFSAIKNLNKEKIEHDGFVNYLQQEKQSLSLMTSKHDTRLSLPLLTRMTDLSGKQYK